MGYASRMSALDTLAADLQAVLDRDPAARSRLEVVVAYPGFHALLAHRVAARLWRRGNTFAARTLSHVSRGLTGIEIHPGARIGRGVFIDHGMGVVIGETSVIGDNCTLYHGVTLGGTSWKQEKRHPTLEDDVVVGAGSKLLGPIQVGRGARIGANSVIVKDVAPGATMVGLPGRQVLRAASATQRPGPWRPDATVGAEDPLLERLAALEAEVRSLKGLPPAVEADEEPMVRGGAPPSPRETREAREHGSPRARLRLVGRGPADRTDGDPS